MNLIAEYADEKEAARIESIMSQADKEEWSVNKLVETLPKSNAGTSAAFVMGMITQKNQLGKTVDEIEKKQRDINKIHDTYVKLARKYNLKQEDLSPYLERSMRDVVWRVRLWKLIWLCSGIIIAQLAMSLSRYLMP